MNINFDAFLDTLPILVKGLLGIFAVTAVIVACIWLLNKGTASKKVLLFTVSVVLGALLTVSIVFGNQPEKALDNYFTALEAPQTISTEKLFPDEFVDYLVTESRNKEKVKDSLIGMFINANENLNSECGEDFRIEYEITKKVQFNEEDFKLLQDNLFDKYKIEKSRVKDVYSFSLEIDIKGNFGSVNESDDFISVKIGNSWYLMNKINEIYLFIGDYYN